MSSSHIVVLIPAYNEASSIGATIEAALAQSVRADRIVVIPNGCTDNTAAIARSYPVTVMELPKLTHRKSEALNRAWSKYGQAAEMIICLDADTILPSNAFGDWWNEFKDTPGLGGSSSKFTMQDPDFLSRLQKAEFATWTDTALRRGRTSVLAGTGCAISGDALRLVSKINGTDMEEIAWTNVSHGTISSAMGSTDESGWTVKLSERMFWLGRKLMVRSQKEWLSCTGATTPHVLSILNSGHRAKTFKMQSTKNDMSSLENSLAPNVEDHILSFEMVESDDVLPAQISTRETTLPQIKSGKMQLDELGVSVGPWSYKSQTEDFLLTHRIRQLGYYCHVSPTVRAYTDSMKDLKSLWKQRMKWNVGTVEDLLMLGVNRLTLRDWFQQLMGLMNASLKVLWLYVMTVMLIVGQVHIAWVWFTLPVLFIALDIKRALRIPHRDWKDIAIAAAFFPNEAFMWLRAGWFIRSWMDVLISKVTRRRTDRWEAQYIAEGI